MKQTLITTAALALIVFSSTAQAKGKVHKAHKKHAHNKGPKALVGDPAEFGALTDKFRAHQRLTAGGGAYYTKQEAKLRSEHASVYQSIQHATLEDRISEEDARNAIDQLITVGKAHQASGSSNTQATSSSLSQIRKEVKAKMTDKVPADTLTPKLNKMQFHLEEVLRFGSESESLSNGDISSLRRKMDTLEGKEDKAKAAGAISARDRENFIEDSRNIWRDALKDFS